MTSPRVALVSVEDTLWYHCVSLVLSCRVHPPTP